MATQSSNAAAPEQPQLVYQWMPPSPQYAVVPIDERDGMLLWLRGEFAAANAMIDALCQHLKEVGEAGEYDGVIGCVEERRCNWKPVLHMQQYFTVSNIAYALQQVGVRKPRRQGKVNNQVDDEARATNESGTKPGVDSSAKSTGGRKASSTGFASTKQLNLLTGVMHIEGSSNAKTDAESKSIPDQALTAIPKTFVSNEMYNGKVVNVTDGLRLYKELLDHSTVSKLISEVNDLRVAGRRGQLQGQTFKATRRPVKGHGREMIQFGLPIVDLPHEGQGTELKLQPIPGVFEDVIERLVAMEVVSDSAKPDCCIIDIFCEGDYMNPQTWPRWFGWPICVLFLTECDMAFGKVMGSESPGDYKGSLMLSLTPGSMLAFEGKSSDYARHALPNTNRERVLVTFTKSLGYLPPPVKLPSHIRHPKKYGPEPARGLLTSSIARPVLQSPTCVPQRFVAPAMPFPAPLPPRLPVPGTGVFLPPSGSGKLVKKQSCTVIPINGNTDGQISPAGKMNTLNNGTPQEGAVYEKLQYLECNGGSVDDKVRGSISKKEEYQVADAKEIAKSMSA